LRVIEGAILGDLGLFTGSNEDQVLTDRSLCLNTRDGVNYKMSITGLTYPDAYRGALGFNFIMGQDASCCFHTVLPPNSPACYDSTNGLCGIYTPTSNHPGGINLSLADGSVRFISETIDAGTTNAAVTSGSSLFGVWGALGSRNGGESTGF
jgi:prepilin-type processing-associated H-X9-DG protein